MIHRSFASLVLMLSLPFFIQCRGNTPDEPPGTQTDILFIIDNSASMYNEAEALAMNFDGFMAQIANIDHQLAITTTDVAATYGALYGDSPIIKPGDDDRSATFQENLLCSATCFNQSMVPSNPAYICGDPVEEVSQEYLNCVCGPDQWAGHCGSGQEEHLEALFMALCRSTNSPPDECFEQNQFEEPDIGSNTGLLRENATLIPVIISDEGDTSRRLAQGEPEPTVYEQLYEKFGRQMTFAVIGPDPYNVCNSGGAVSWGVDRFQYFIDETQGGWFGG